MEAQPENPDFQGRPLSEIPPEASNLQELPEQQPVLQKKSVEWYAIVFLEIMAVFLIMGLLGAVILCIRNLVRHKKYAKADDLEKIQLQLKRVLRLGKLCGFAWSDAETLQSYRERANTVLDTEEYSFARACAVYEKIRFGGKSISSAELQELEAYAEKLEREYLAGCDRMKQFMYLVL